MKADDLTEHQCAYLGNKLRPALAFLERFKTRLTETEFPAHDPLLIRVCAALEATQELANELTIRAAGGQGKTEEAKPVPFDVLTGKSKRHSVIRERMKLERQTVYLRRKRKGRK